jgi:hypothetical protein
MADGYRPARGLPRKVELEYFAAAITVIGALYVLATVWGRPNRAKRAFENGRAVAW